ncbi:unnamed protein product [Orchesella dallaii]|uniref:Superkiller viralicidic activity 2-like 2 n=1 Tax=Orchesella dallaii TaxID=48710 RepID=A0ABP1S9J9_9HEXA
MADEDDIFGEAFDVFEKASGGVDTHSKPSKKTEFTDSESGTDESDSEFDVNSGVKIPIEGVEPIVPGKEAAKEPEPSPGPSGANANKEVEVEDVIIDEDIAEVVDDKSSEPVADRKSVKRPIAIEENEGEAKEAEEDETKKGVKRPSKVRKEDDTKDGDGEEEDTSSTKKSANDIAALQRFLPQVEVKTLETAEGGGCSHVVAIPSNAYYIPLHPIEKPVKTWPFKLDNFQERAITCVDNYQSVLVSAHTSAGKTVVAEYAIAKGLKDNQRVIYTTPIKALSNQKYREFYEQFKDVGLITGDVTISPSASCLIMTTEILRNMLYRGSEIMREVGWVIFDEIHYMRDKERGVVWEETIILLPKNTHYVFLSATIPNAMQFSEWICYLHKQPCNVIHTDYRPTPLHHYLYPVGGDGIHLVVDETGTFREEGFNMAVSMLSSSGQGGAGGAGGGRRNNMRQGQGQRKGEDSPCHKVIKMAMEHDLAPVIVFSFSKKDCEQYALQLSKMDFNTAEDKQLVEEVFVNAIDVLSKEDQKLPQVVNLLPLLKRGIGIHHGGLLPLLKETIEILFSEGLIKVLFATETFAMGLNMPARTVLFTNVRKYDGKTYRWITSGEYIQMSGRAGRRGLDDKGVSIVMVDEKISPSVGRALFKGAADPINSAFHLTYNMVLNLMRVEEINPEYMMERSFFQFQNYSTIPAICRKLQEAEDEYETLEVPREEEISSYHDLRKQLETFATEFRGFITRPKYIVPFLQPGRLLHIKQGDMDFQWGAVVNFQRKENPRENPVNSTPVYVIDVLLHVAGSCAEGTAMQIKPPAKGETGEMKVIPVSLNVVQKISQVRLYLSNDLRPMDNRMKVLKSIEEVRRRFPDGVPLLDPVQDMKIKDRSFDELVRNIKKFEDRMQSHPLHSDPETKTLFELYEKKVKLHQNVTTAKAELRKAKSLLQMDELKCRKRVLRRLGYASADDVIEIKGRVACELTSGDELLLTEMIFNGMFISLDVPRAVALLSCVVCDERSNEVPKLSEELSGALKMMQDIARQIAKVSKESKLEIDEDEYVDQFKPYLMDVVHEWCKGATFSKLCEMTDIFEGGIIRCMRRLEELLRQMSLAAKVIGNKELEEKFSEGVKLIKRDIVFAASLYL